jgi:predicted butyrate kinase (DUF1464 family)
MTKSILTGASALALVIGLGFAPAYANPTVKDSTTDDVTVDIHVGKIYGDEVNIESYNAAVLSENTLTATVHGGSLGLLSYVGGGELDFEDSYVQKYAAGQFTQVFNSGGFNANNSAGSIAANAEINFTSND